MKKVAVVNPELGFAGPDTVAVWMMHALKENYKLSLITTEIPDFPKLNNFFNCQLDNTIEIVVIPLPKFLQNTPKARLIKQHLLMRYCKKHKQDYDAFISAYGEMDFGKLGIQYVHFPQVDAEASLVLNKQFYRDSFQRNLYKKIAHFLSGYSIETMKKNITVANSEWTKNVVDNAYGIDSGVLYPPVLDDIEKLSWEDKKDGFVFIGRMSPDKRPLELIQIIKNVRQQGLDVCIYLIGNAGVDTDYVKNIEEEARANPSWIYYKGKVSRERLREIVSKNRYGISGKKFEHFGIAVAEMVKAGNIMFINNDGGQVDIVGRDSDLIYNSDEDAIEKIIKIVNDSNLQKEKKDKLSILSERFSVNNFIQEVNNLVEICLRGAE